MTEHLASRPPGAATTASSGPRPRVALADAVRARPLVWFFSLAFAISWLGWLPYVFSSSGLGLLPYDVPALLGTTQLVGVLPGAYLGPFTAALVVTAVAEGRPGLRAWAGRLLRWRVSWRWYAVVLLAVPAVALLATAALPAAGGSVQQLTLAAALTYLPVLVLQFFTTAVAEEPGWRDFALPRLQRRHGPVPGTAILGVLWGCWHLPLFLTAWGGPDVAWWMPVEFVALCVPLSLVMTWVFNRTGQSLPIVMIMHASINTTFTVLWPVLFSQLDYAKDTLHAVLLASTVTAVLLLVATRGRLGLRSRDNAEPSHVLLAAG